MTPHLLAMLAMTTLSVNYWASTTLMSKPQVVGRIPPKAYYAMHDFKII